jgi:hypothetical protein
MLETLKTCNRCKVGYPLRNFYVRSASKDGRAHRCKKCDREVVAEWNKKHPRAQWGINLRRYGLTPERYEEMLIEQGGRCAICSEEPKRYRLHVDHDHTTGAVRSLLCGNCNSGIGMFREDPWLLRRASRYLVEFP